MTVLVALVLWQWMVKWTGVPNWILPAPSEIGVAFWENRGIIWSNSWPTIRITLLGLGLAVMTALVVALSMNLSHWVKRALYPLLITSQTVPIIALAPLFLIWFGYGVLPKVLVVALVCFFPIAVNLLTGFQETDEDMRKLMDAMGAGKWKRFLKLELPSSLPYFFTGLKIAATYSVMGAVIGEWLGGSEGLGLQLVRASQSFATDLFFAIILVIVTLSLAMVGLVVAFSYLLMPWNR